MLCSALYIGINGTSLFGAFINAPLTFVRQSTGILTQSPDETKRKKNKNEKKKHTSIRSLAACLKQHSKVWNSLC